MIKVMLADDQALVRQGIESLLSLSEKVTVVGQAANGAEVLERINTLQPDVLLLDIRMPVMDGFETAEWLTENHPDIKFLALSMEDDEQTILKMLRKGAKGYLLKDIHPDKLNIALQETVNKGYYHSDKVATTMLHALHNKNKTSEEPFKENELIFLQLACSEMTYKEIAYQMNLSPKTIDGYRPKCSMI